MTSPRFDTALAEGRLTFEGPLWLLRPPVGGQVPKDVHVTHGFKPAHDWWTASGAAMDRPSAPGAALVTVSRSKSLARALVAEAASAPLVIVDGQKTDGVESLFKAVRAMGAAVESLTKAHGRLFWFAVDAELRASLADWANPGPTLGPDGFYRQPGVFSEAGMDKGSAALIAALPDRLPSHLVDLGAGWGALTRAALSKTGVTCVDAVEAEALSAACLRLNVDDPRVHVHWADALTFRPETLADGVLMNPPFHQGRKGEPDLGQSFVKAAAGLLTPRGQMWMVANRHLPYEAALAENFRDVRELEGTAGFKIFHCQRPSRSAGRNQLA